MKGNMNKYLPIIIGVIALAVGVVGLMLSSQPTNVKGNQTMEQTKQLTNVTNKTTVSQNNTNQTNETKVAEELLKALDELLNS